MQKAVQTWSEYIAQTGSSLLEMSQQTASAYLDSLYEKACSILPSQLNELMFLERSFAFAKLPVDGTKTVVAMHRINNKDFIMVASYTGYLFIYAMNPNGGECSLESQHIIGPLSEEQDYQESRLNERREHLTEVNQTPTAPRLYPSLHVDEEEK
uniref:Uncharacterized protein n=1 Tax=Acrobeloides nanus TaxID=290746 RepID=A0A914D979_9BILA